MKNLKFILVMAISIMALSCGDDDDGGDSGPTLTVDSVAGTYSLNFLEATSVEITSVSGGTVTTTTTIVGDTFGDSNIVFNADGTYVSDFQFRITETTQLEDNDPEVETYIETSTDTGSYAVNDENQTITIDGDTGTVTLFNSSSLRLTFSETEIEGNDSFSFDQEVRFTRQ